MIIFELSKNSLTKILVIYKLSQFKSGNFNLVNNNNEIITSIVNNHMAPISIIKIHNEDKFFNNVFYKGELGLGETYMTGIWSTEHLINFTNTLWLNIEHDNVSHKNTKYIDYLLYDKKNITSHYDISNDFYLKFLTDDLNAYTCGFWFNEFDTLNTAQYNKVNAIIKKMNPIEGSSILDIGCGWGAIANYVANTTNCKVTGITISDEQCKHVGIIYDKSKVNIINLDYRLLSQKFDYLYSIGMFEHVRYENYDTFFKIIKKCLNPGGKFVLHTIISFTINDPNDYDYNTFINTYIFPGGQIPNNDWILSKIKNNGLNVIHFEGYGGQHYAKTLAS